MKPVTKKPLPTLLSIVLSAILVVGGIPAPALAEMAEEAASAPAAAVCAESAQMAIEIAAR